MPSKPNPGDGSIDGDGLETIGYAAATAELEEILAELEDDEIDVDVLALRVRRAATLIRVCRSRIADARLEVESIVAELDDAASLDAGPADVISPRPPSPQPSHEEEA